MIISKKMSAAPYRMSKWRRAIFSPSFENSAMPHRDASAAHWRSRGAAASAPLPEDHPEAFLELVRGPEGLVGVRDVLEPGALGGVQVRLVLQQRPPGALDRVPDAFAGRAGPPGLAPCGAVLTLSSASAARATMWKPSRMRSVCGRRRNTHPSIHRAPLPVTTPMEARRPGVSVRKNRSKTFSPCPVFSQVGVSCFVTNFFGFRHEECRPVVCFTGCPSCRT